MAKSSENTQRKFKPGEEAEEYVREYFKEKGINLVPAESGSGPDFRDSKSTLFVEVKGTKHRSISAVSPYLTDTQYQKARECLENGTKFELHVVLGIGSESNSHYIFPGEFILKNIVKEIWWKLPLRKEANSYLIKNKNRNNSETKSTSGSIKDESSKDMSNSNNKPASSLSNLLKRADADIEQLFIELKSKVHSIAPECIERPTQTYVGFHESRMFIAVEIGKSFLTLWMLLRKTDWKAKDPDNKVEVLDEDYKWSLKTRIKLHSSQDVKYVLPLIKHARDTARNLATN